MPGPTRLIDLMEYLRVPDRHARLMVIVDRVVPGQIAPDRIPSAESIAALVWASSDMVRTVSDVIAPFVPAERDRILGARAMLVRLGRLGILVEQPEVDGPLAACLSRYGEGVGAVYVRASGAVPPPDARGRPPRPTPSPLGIPGWLLPHEWPWGPFVVLLAQS